MITSDRYPGPWTPMLLLVAVVYALVLAACCPPATSSLITPRPRHPTLYVTVVDTDNDGIPDDRDRCPQKKEDHDNFRDGDGCPDIDNDGDGIPDTRDRCPNERENLNNYQDEDGCPERRYIYQGGLPVSWFTLGSATLTAEGKALFWKLVHVYLKLPRTKVLIIEAHTDTHELVDHKRLSEMRARVVATALIQEGVNPKWLRTIGRGDSIPLVDYPPKFRRPAFNRRVTFMLGI